MDRLSRKLTHIEKTLNKMKKEIIKINNRNDIKSKSSSRNKRNYNKNNRVLTNQQNYDIKKSTPKKNYFQLTAKEKIFKEDRKKMHKSRIPNDKKLQKDNYYIYKDTNNYIDNNILLMENNFGYKSKNIFFDYKSKAKQNNRTSLFNNSYLRDSNNSKITNNTSYHNKKNYFKNLSVDEKAILKEGININHNENYQKNNQSQYSFNNNYNSCVNINEHFNNSQLARNPQHKNNKMYNSTINLKSNIYKLKNINNSKSKFNDFENLKKKIINSNKNDDVENSYYKEKYKYLINILKNRNIEEINNNANLFEKYGISGFKKFWDKRKLTSNDNNDWLNCLLEYKNYIECLNTKNQYYYKKQIENYKCLCRKLIHLTKHEDLENIKDKINYKLQKNQYNSNVLINIQNVLNYLDLENN